LIQSDTGTFHVFKSWGRVGYGGQSSLTECSDVEKAMKEFAKAYREKTRNAWKSPLPFQKVDGKYHPIEVDTNPEPEDKAGKTKAKIIPTAPSKLHIRLQKLLEMLFDVNSMKQSMRDYGLDTEKMPLGKLSKKQLFDAYKVLTDLSNLVSRNASQDQLIEASNRFFTLMPHDFGMTRAPIINNNFLIKAKQEMIDNLLQIEVACNIMKVDDEEEEVKEKKNLLDAQYEAMKTEMEPLDHDSEEFDMIKRYMQNTHAETHHFKLVLEDVFKVQREGEKDRYKPFSKLHNRQLLWHGSRKTNFVGILSNGLRIAPKEAPVGF
jgi:predicted DNA-binding WGR domain protein